jgi:hypothetical protein
VVGSELQEQLVQSLAALLVEGREELVLELPRHLAEA